MRNRSIKGRRSAGASAVTSFGDERVADYSVSNVRFAYTGKHLEPRATCKKAAALDANEAFAQANGFAGTPVIVRARDGAVLHGYRDAKTLHAFANAKTGSKQ